LVNQTEKGQRQLDYLVIGCSLAIVAISVGIQQTFGLFMLPISKELSWGREILSLALAGQALIIGIAAPFVAAIGDKWGVSKVIIFGGLTYVVGIILMSQSTTPISMFLSAGLIVGVSAAACGMPMILSIVSHIVTAEKRSVWLGTVTAFGTLGQFLIVPFSQQLIERLGWANALIGLAFIVALVVPLASISKNIKHNQDRVSSQKLGEALIEAQKHSGYLMLIVGFFVCGFQTRFIATHLPAYLGDLHFTSELAAQSLVVIAVFNGIGSWGFGFLGGRYRKKYLLCWLYAFRALVIYLFISTPPSEITILLFSGCVGLLWLGTVPLNSGMVAQIFGTRYMATLFGIVFLGHQVGSFLGVWLGGKLFDTTGSYEIIWWVSIGLGVLATLIHLLINDTPTSRLSTPTLETNA